jgi:hypothetical protein
MKYKARDVEQLYREKGPNMASMELFIVIIEHIAVMNQQMNELTMTCNKMIDMLGATAAGYGDLRKQVERVRRKQGEDDLPDNI